MEKAKRTVLVIDDSKEYRFLLGHIFRKEGLNVAFAINGSDALTYLENHAPPAVIVLDLHMPVMDGREFCAAVKCNERIRNIPIIIYSTELEDERQQLQVASRVSKAQPVKQIVEKVLSLAIGPTTDSSPS